MPLIILLLAVAALSGASSASLPTITATLHQNSPCPPTSGRQFCVDLTTHDGLARNGGIEVDLQLENWGGSTLTNPKIVLSWAADPVGAAGPLSLQLASPAPSSCSTSGTGVSCSFANIPGVGANGTPPVRSPVVQLFFTVAADASVTGVNFTATGTAKESCNDGCPGGAAQLEQEIATGLMPFGTDPNSSASVALGGNPLTLNAALNTSSVKFAVPAGTTPFLAKFAASQGPTTCFGGITCTGLLLDTDLSGSPPSTFSIGNQILWVATINSTTTNVDAFHYYDPVGVTASAQTKTFTSTKSFAACDGVNFVTAPAGLNANQDYFVVNATATSFQVASAANGKALSFTQSGSFSASCIRVIGDQKAEKTTSCDPLNPPSQSPALDAAKLTNSTVQVCLWDTGNGHIGY